MTTMVSQTRPSVSIDLQTVRKIVCERLKEYKVKVYLFGSQAAGKTYRSSDIDVAVLPLQPVPGWVFAEIRDALEESDALYPVDLVNLSDADEAFRQRVMREGVVWKE